MPIWCSEIEVAGTVFTGCRGEILDQQEFASPYRGSVEWTNAGKANSQTMNTSHKGTQFGLQMVSSEITKFNSMMTAIRAAQAANSTFEVHLVNELYEIRVNATVDYTQRWLQHGQPHSGYVADVILRFISQGLIP